MPMGDSEGGRPSVSWYITIRGASDYSQFAMTDSLVEYLVAMPELRQTGPVAFGSADGYPWVSVLLAACGPTGNYASTGEAMPQVNVVELVCSDFGDSEWYDSLAGRITDFLGWAAFDDHEMR
jgi:hypothetical protein